MPRPTSASFNPITQGFKFDPDGDYIARWVPELRHLPIPFRHEPWKLSSLPMQSVFAFRLGTDYPQRIVDHAFARQRTLEAYKAAREKK
jgi:deoxyribodipyrimidine photo-lyase